MNFMWGKRKFNILIISLIFAILTMACSGAASNLSTGATVVENRTNHDEKNSETSSDQDVQQTEDPSALEDKVPLASEAGESKQEDQSTQEEDIVYRDNTPVVLEPSSPGIDVCGNEVVTIDMSNDSEGYITVYYHGLNNKVKFQITGPDNVTYTYDLDDNIDVIPLTSGNGSYNIGCYENISGIEYAVAYTDVINITVDNEFGAYLYPNLYVNFNKNTKAVELSKDLVKEATCDLDVVYAVYKYTIENITYDYDLAETVASGYLPDVDAVLSKKSGICFDYAVLMCTMLRSQGIPSRLEIGYAGSAYHAWISTYIEDVGWIDGIIEFDGSSWTLMDPTFAANSSKDAFEKFIGDGNNYVTIYVY